MIFRNTLLALSCALSFWLSPGALRAQDTNAPATTNTAEEPSTSPSSAIATNITQQRKGHRPTAPTAPTVPSTLPPEVLNRLTPNQIMEIMQPQLGRPRQPDVNDIVFLITFPTISFVIVLTLVIARLRRNRMLHETIRYMIEKGAPIPPELLQPPTPPKPRNDLRNGILLIGGGIGLALALSGKGGHAYMIGFIAIFLGIAFLVVWKLERKQPE